jgi:hypothetical protein
MAMSSEESVRSQAVFWPPSLLSFEIEGILAR